MRTNLLKVGFRESGTLSMALLFALGGVVFPAGGALAAGEESKGEIHVYVTDAKGKVPDLTAATVLVYVEPKGAKRETLKTTLRTPPAEHGGEGHKGGEHGKGIPKDAEVKKAGAWLVGVEFHTPHEHGERGHEEGEGHEHGEKDASGHKEEMGMGPAIAHFVAPVDLEGREFDVAVALKIGSETVNARGFHYPPKRALESFAAGVESIEEAIEEMEHLVEAGKLSKIHEVADGIRATARALGGTKDAPKDARLEATAKELVDLFESIDEAADAGKAAETRAVLEKYRNALRELKKLGSSGS